MLPPFMKLISNLTSVIKIVIINRLQNTFSSLKLAINKMKVLIYLNFSMPVVAISQFMKNKEHLFYRTVLSQFQWRGV